MSKKDKIECCQSKAIHVDAVEKVKKKLPDNERLFELAELFKVFGDSTRIRILQGLMVAELCVCDIAELLGMEQSAISHQLRILRQMNLVKYRRAGKVIYYSLSDNHISSIFELGFEHINER